MINNNNYLNINKCHWKNNQKKMNIPFWWLIYWYEDSLFLLLWLVYNCSYWKKILEKQIINFESHYLNLLLSMILHWQSHYFQLWYLNMLNNDIIYIKIAFSRESHYYEKVLEELIRDLYHKLLKHYKHYYKLHK